MDSVFFVFEMIGVIAFALSGAMLAIQNEMDILGVCVLGATTATGGGIMRDVLLGVTPPSALTDPIAILVSVAVSIAVFLPFIQKLLRGRSHIIYDRLMLIADSIGLGIFTVMGVNVSFLRLEAPSAFICVFLGVMSGVGGGVLRDIMSKNKPYIFVKHFYACAAIVGALLCTVLRPYIGELSSSLVGFSVIFLLSMLAVRFHWQLPKYSQIGATKRQK
ncbi:MAG: TRIC cation channel family protein [Clostridia bacterium]|nr:TRIC cation channel family protein [Clostridia bacterium]